MLSIVIPTQNRCCLLEETINSVITQSHSDWELIIVDDASTDGTQDSVSILATKEPRIRYLKHGEVPRGAPFCRNLGFRESRGEFVLFLDSDDLLAPKCLEERVAVLRDNPTLDFVVGDASLFRKVPGDVGLDFGIGSERHDFQRCLSMHYPWQTSAPLWRRKAVVKIGCWDESLVIGQDLDYTFRALISGLKYRRLNYVDYHYRITPDSIGKSFKSQSVTCSHLRRIRTMQKLLLEHRRMDYKNNILLAGNMLWVSQYMACEGLVAEAISLWKKSVKTMNVSWKDSIVGAWLLHSIKWRKVNVFLPVFLFLLPRGLLIYPSYEVPNKEKGEVSSAYQPLHYPLQARQFNHNGSFSLSVWFVHSFRSVICYLQMFFRSGERLPIRF